MAVTTEHEAPSEKVIESLKAELPATGVLSAVINVNPGHPDNQGGAMFIRAKNMLGGLGAPAELTGPVLADLEDAQRQSGRARAYYMFENGQHAVSVSLDMPESARYGAPDLEPLYQVLEANPPLAIALVDHERGRLFMVNLGSIVERRRLENTLENDAAFTANAFRDVDLQGRTRSAHSVNNPDTDGGMKVSDDKRDYDLFSAQAANQETLFFKDIAHRLDQMRQAGDFERLLVAGPVKPLTHFKSELSHDLAGRLVGEFHVEARAGAAEVLAAAHEAMAAADREADFAKIKEARERGVRGPADTIEAVQAGRVYELLVSGDGTAVSVYQDTDPDSAFLFATYPEQGQSPISGQAVEGKTLHDVLPMLRERYGVRVNFLDGENAQLVAVEMDGVAGLTRF